VKAFAAIPILERPNKPRESGITMIHETGMGLAAQEEYLTVYGEYVDLAKIPVGYSRLLDAQLLKDKIALYTRHQVIPFPGGQFLEYAFIKGKVREFMQGAVEVGYPAIEVSDNIITLTPTEKADLIRAAVKEFGLRVLGEVGKKEGLQSSPLAEDIKRCLAAGAWKVFVEAADLFAEGKDPRTAAENLMQGTGVALKDVIFELPGYWIPGTRYSDPTHIARELLDAFGPGVNLANVNANEVLHLETVRRGIGPNAGVETVTGH